MSRNQGITHTPKILFVTTVSITLEAFLLPFARALRARGACVDALSSNISSISALADEFDHTFELPWSRSPRCLLHYRSLARALRALVIRENYDTVWVHTPIAALITRAALRKLGRRDGTQQRPRIIYTAHGFHFYKGGRPLLQQWFFHFVEYRARNWADVLVIMNDEDEERASRWFKGATSQAELGPRQRCQLVRINGIGIDPDSWERVKLDDAREAALRAHFNIPMGSFVVTMIAEMNANKRHWLLIEAAALLKRQGALPWLRVLLIGQGPLADDLRRLINQCQLSDTILCAGQLEAEELRELFALTNLGVLVSAREGLPRSLMEMIAAGIPVAGTPTRGIIDEVADERALTAEVSAGELAALIESLAKDTALRAELARLQYERLQERYALDKILPQYLDLLS